MDEFVRGLVDERMYDWIDTYLSRSIGGWIETQVIWIYGLMDLYVPLTGMINSLVDKSVHLMNE